MGVPGEIYTGGDGLARGYYNRPELTEEKFISNPFGEGRLYRTGDRGRYLPDSNIEFLGRIDNQVKIRGFRIEPGEIEAALSEHPMVQDNAVVAREGSEGEKQLIGYVVLKHEGLLPELREHLKERLPDYMIPSRFVLMDRLPLTPSGKVDRKALPAPDESERLQTENYIPPRDTLELKLVQIWETLLNTGPVGIRDNFFDLGGHSLLAVRLLAQIRKVFGREISVSALFQGATIEKMAIMLREEKDPLPWSPLVPIQPRGSKRPFFCIHPVGGTVICYMNLAQAIGVDRPFYGLQARGLEEGQEFITEVEELAAFYIDAIKTVQPQGPYLLGGWSFGGIVAFEMARQLKAEGQEVELLALLDSISPASDQFSNKSDDENLLTGLAEAVNIKLPENFRRLDPQEQSEIFLETAKNAYIVPANVGLSQFSRFLDCFEINQRALLSYRPSTYSGRVVFLRATEAGTSDGLDLKGWKEYCNQPIDLYDVPGNHNSMIQSPNVDIVADILNRSFEMSEVEIV